MASEPPRELVLFSLHGELYAVPVGAVSEIVRYTPPRVTATAHGDVQGLVNLRGVVLPLVDLSRRLGRELEVDSSTRIMVLGVAGGPVGLVVSAVEGVESIPAEAIGPMPPAARGMALGEEVAALGDRLVMVIDPERLLDAGPTASTARPPQLSMFLRPLDLGP